MTPYHNRWVLIAGLWCLGTGLVGIHWGSFVTALGGMLVGIGAAMAGRW